MQSFLLLLFFFWVNIFFSENVFEKSFSKKVLIRDDLSCAAKYDPQWSHLAFKDNHLIDLNLQTIHLKIMLIRHQLMLGQIIYFLSPILFAYCFLLEYPKAFFPFWKINGKLYIFLQTNPQKLFKVIFPSLEKKGR